MAEQTHAAAQRAVQSINLPIPDPDAVRLAATLAETERAYADACAVYENPPRDIPGEVRDRHLNAIDAARQALADHPAAGLQGLLVKAGVLADAARPDGPGLSEVEAPLVLSLAEDLKRISAGC